MLPKRFSLLFYLKKPKNYVKGKQPIYIRITIDAARIEMATQRSCEVERWNPDSGRVNGASITVNNVKKNLKGETEHPHMIIEIFQQHNNQIAHLVGKDFATGTIERYKTSLEHTRNFIQWKYNRVDLDISKLNYEFISEYAFWLKSIRNCNHNSTMKYLANFKKIVLICIKNGWIQNDALRFILQISIL
jgi:hypothetical protein